MSSIPSPGHVLLHRFLDQERQIILSVGDFTDFFAAYQNHVELWGEPLDGLSDVFLRQGLAAGVIHLSNEPRDMSFGLTIHIVKPPTNVFIAGDSRESAVTGRIHVDGVKELESSRLYMQSQRPNREPSLSIIEVHSLDLLDFYEKYYRESEQRPARFFELDEASFAQVAALPGADPDFFPGLDRDQTKELLAQEDLQLLEARPFFFQCGCNPDRMITALRQMFGGNPEEIFEGDPKIEVTCPRCGRRWWVSREEFDKYEDSGPEES